MEEVIHMNINILKGLPAKIAIIGLFLSIIPSGIVAQPPRLSQFGHGGASVLPVTFWKKPQGPVLYAILGREAGGSGKGTWDDFGGGRDQGEKHPVVTAAREFAEEANTAATIGLHTNDIRNFIDVTSDNTRNNTWCVVAQKAAGNGTNFVTYFTQFDHKTIEVIRKNFDRARRQATQWKFKEKDRIASVRWDELVNAIKNSTSSQNVQVSARVFDPKTGKDKPNREMIQLRPFFVAKLRKHFKDCPHTIGKNPIIRFYQ